MASPTFIDHLLEGDHASRPAAGDVPEGTLYSCSDHTLIYQSDMSSWSTWWAGSAAGLAAHLSDASDAHDASAISVLDTAGKFTATDAEGVFAELQDNIDAVIAGAAHVTFTIGPYLINDIPGTATTQMLLPFMNTTSAVSLGANGVEYRVAPACHIIGAILVSDNARTAGTATLQVRVGGTPTAFAAGAVVLDGTNTTRAASLVAHASGVAATANSSIGVAIVTSGWTPTTANLNALLVVSID